MIDVAGMTKKFGSKLAVDDLSFTVRSGMVTGFLGPNGAGKSTTMRLVLGLDTPTRGQARVNGRTYTKTKAPMTEVGALLEAKSVHPGRTARNHLRALAATHGISKKRVDDMIELVGLSDVAGKKAGEFSLGMSQRLGLAAALLGDPETLILDEPINGLDPEGVAWVRNLVKYLASEGRTIFISSHLMSEMAMVADHIIIIGMGRLIVDSEMSDLVMQASGLVTKVRSPNAAAIIQAVNRSGRSATDEGDSTISIRGLTAQAIGEEAAKRGWVLHELTPIQRSLEEIYMEMTDSAVEFVTGAVPRTEPDQLRDQPPTLSSLAKSSSARRGR
ncbi:MAG: ATP-binding cassette domain-containing protein [Propionibacteriaceae bacterium]|nr:ATP-binding cassette domain-containing protein [Propionibacteriaceae bacterium]